MASRMLSKAARDAVKSVQAVGAVSHSATSSRHQPKVELDAEEEWVDDEDRERSEDRSGKEKGEEKSPEQVRTESPKQHNRKEAAPVEVVEEARPIQT